MKTTHVFSNDAYFQTIKPTIRSVYIPNVQRGGGLGATLGYIGRYTLPVIQNRVVPHVKSAIIGSLKDVMEGKNVQAVIKDRTTELVKEVGKDIYNAVSKRGSGISRISKQGSRNLQSVSSKPSTKKQVKRKASKTKEPTAKKQKLLTKTDIFS